MKFSRISQSTIGLLILCLSHSGCGSTVSDQPDLGLVSGTVSFEGEPLPGASITFLPDNGRPATGITNTEGKYELTYIRDTPGCKVGPNKVMITTVAEGMDDIEAEGDDADQTKISDAKEEKIPAKYNTKTELEADVKPGENVFDFHLEN